MIIVEPMELGDSSSDPALEASNTVRRSAIDGMVLTEATPRG